MRPLRILVLAPHPYYIDRGSPIDVDLLVRVLSNRGDVVDLVVYPDGETRQYPGVNVHRAECPAWVGMPGPGFSWRKLVADYYLFRKAREIVTRGNYDLIHAGEETVFMALWFRRKHGLPYVYDMDSSLAQQLVESKPWLWPFKRLFAWCERHAIRRATAVAPVCNALADLARDAGARHVKTLHDISQLSAGDFVSRGAVRTVLGLHGKILMYVGNLEPYQGIDLLLEAFSRVRAKDSSIDLVIAGGSPRRVRQYQKKAHDLGISSKTHFIGAWPAARLGELLAEADILAAPRIRGINTPMKVFPYLHSGRPVVVTALRTHTQILDGSICELGSPDPEGFAEAILRLAHDPERAARIGAAAREFVERNHTFPAHQNRVQELYGVVRQALSLHVLFEFFSTISEYSLL
jgi:glycosyltransferase involved in cell wall biosynthesis